MTRCFSFIGFCVTALLAVPSVAFASEGAGGGSGTIAIASAIAIAIAAFGGTLSQSKAISAGLEAIGRNPSASGKVFTPLLLGLAFIESLVILSFVIAIMLKGLV